MNKNLKKNKACYYSGNTPIFPMKKETLGQFDPVLFYLYHFKYIYPISLEKF